MLDSHASRLADAVVIELRNCPINVSDVTDCLENLLSYLTTSEGRTDNNCKGADLYFTKNDEWVEVDLPEYLHDIFSDMTGALHDTCSDPDIAVNFDSTPEQLLSRLQIHKNAG